MSHLLNVQSNILFTFATGTQSSSNGCLDLWPPDGGFVRSAAGRHESGEVVVLVKYLFLNEKYVLYLLSPN